MGGGSGGGPRRVGPKGLGAPKGGGPEGEKGGGEGGGGGHEGCGSQKIAFFPFPATIFIFSSLFLGVSRGILVVFLKGGTIKCARLGSEGCRLKPRGPRGIHTTAEELQTCTCEGLALSTRTSLLSHHPTPNRSPSPKTKIGQSRAGQNRNAGQSRN